MFDETATDRTESVLAESMLGVVLAGGKSSRMGCDKALLVHTNGQTYLQHAIARLSVLTPHVAISGRPVEDGAILSIPDQIADQGPAVAVWSAIRFARELGMNAILVTPVDMPFLEAGSLRQIVAASKGRPVCAEVTGGVPHPLVGFYPVDFETQLQAVALSTGRSLRDWFEQQSHPRVSLPDSVLHDVNTKSDFVNSQFPLIHR